MYGPGGGGGDGDKMGGGGGWFNERVGGEELGVKSVMIR